MKSISNHQSVYELRLARFYALRIAQMVEGSVWGLNDPLPAELSVKESNRLEENESAPAATIFTFRFQGGTVVRVTLTGRNDWNYGFQWWIESATVRFYQEATDSQYPSLAGEKKEKSFQKEFFYQENWWKGSLKD